MTKYLSKEGLNLYDSLIKEHIDIKLQNTIDLLAYGVEWDTEVADPHLTRIGNMSFHRTLPIQSGMKPCIVQGDKVMYYLDFHPVWGIPIKKDREYIPNNSIIVTPGTEENLGSDAVYSITNDVFKTKRFNVNDKIILEESVNILYISSIDRTTGTATLVFGKSSNLPSQPDIQDSQLLLQACLNGYDGTVAVEVPEFYIKSFIEGTKRKVYISTIKIDDTWCHQKKCLVDSFRCTVLNTVPEDMGYLSTLPVNSAISVVNTESYCRGGGNRTAFDDYLNTDPFRTDLGKPRTAISRGTMRTYARKAGKEIMSYIQYKNILYWLWVVEYANFNCQETYKESVTELGYRQGGMGPGVTTLNYNYWTYYNNNYPITPNGYTYNRVSSISNKDNTGIAQAQVITPTESGGDPTQIYNIGVPLWRGIENPFGDIYHNLDGIIIQGDTEGNPKKVYITDNPDNYGDDEEAKSKMRISGYQLHTDGYIKYFDLGEEANIIPSTVGASTSTYKCDYQYTGAKDTSLRALFFGGYAGHGGYAGLGSFYSAVSVGSAYATHGFRLIKEID